MRFSFLVKCGGRFSCYHLKVFPLQRQNCTLVATGFFIKDSSIVTPQTSGHLAWSWVIYRGCQPFSSIFPWMQPLIHTLLLKPSGMLNVLYWFKCNKSIHLGHFIPLHFCLSSCPKLPRSEQASVRSHDEGWQHRSFFRQFMHFKWKCTEVPRALFNHMLLPAFSLPGGNSWKMWSKTAEK